MCVGIDLAAASENGCLVVNGKPHAAHRQAGLLASECMGV